jgi:hypothetical protein
MEEFEVPTEKLQEEMEHHARTSGEQWVTGVALTAALLAVFAAVSSLLAGHHSNEAMIDQLQASDQWAYYQAKGIKLAILETRISLAREMGKGVATKDTAKISSYLLEQSGIQAAAREKEKSSEWHLKMHNALARCVTLFQIAIAICAISAISKQKWLWVASILTGIAGIGLLIGAHM